MKIFIYTRIFGLFECESFGFQFTLINNFKRVKNFEEEKKM